MTTAKRKRTIVEVNEGLKGFRELSRLRGPTMKEFAEAHDIAGVSSAQGVFSRLMNLGWIAPESVEGSSRVVYVLTPSGERRYRELVPNPEDRRGPEWPTD